MLLTDCPPPHHGRSADPAFLHDVLEGLSRSPKATPPIWFYDRRGSELFEAITDLPEYYPTRTEAALLESHGADFRDAIGTGRAVVEFGAGSARKTPHLLRAIDPAAYVPIDISGDFLHASSAKLASAFPGLPVLPVVGDFNTELALPAGIEGRPRLGFFPGSTIGNLEPGAAVDLLRSMRRLLGDDAMLLIGMDRIKDQDRLIAAYDDAAGVTAAFNLNLITRINRELETCRSMALPTGRDGMTSRHGLKCIWKPCVRCTSTSLPIVSTWRRGKRSTPKAATNTACGMQGCCSAQAGGSRFANGWTPKDYFH